MKNLPHEHSHPPNIKIIYTPNPPQNLKSSASPGPPGEVSAQQTEGVFLTLHRVPRLARLRQAVASLPPSPSGRGPG